MSVEKCCRDQVELTQEKTGGVGLPKAIRAPKMPRVYCTCGYRILCFPNGFLSDPSLLGSPFLHFRVM